MRKLISLITLFSFSLQAATITDDKLTVGKKASASAKEIVFDTNDGAANKKLSVDKVTKKLSATSDEVIVGDGTASDKALTFNRGGSNASIKWDEATAKLQFSNDNVTFKDFGSGSISGRNLVLNGAMVWDQNKEGGVYTSSATEVYSLDQWRFAGSGAGGIFTIQKVASSAPGFPFSLNHTVGTQQASLGATDNFHLEYPIEGSRISSLKYGTPSAVTTTLSFWARASTIGSWPVSLMEGTNSRSYVTSFNINTANTWEYKTVIIAGDTTGTYQTNDATFGLKILWGLGVGSNFSTSTVNVWQSGAFWNKTGTNQLITQVAGSTLFITGVQFEIGTNATTFEYLDPSFELSLLQRYYFKTFPKGVAVAQGNGASGALIYLQTAAANVYNSIHVRYPVHMMSTPTITTYNTSSANANWRQISNNLDSGIPSFLGASSDSFTIFNPNAEATAAGVAIQLTANARLGGM